MKKSILFILPFFPYPLVSGGHQALYNGIIAVKDDFDIYIAYRARNDEVYKNAVEAFKKKNPSIKLFPLLSEVHKTNLLISLLRKVCHYASNPFRKRRYNNSNNESDGLCLAWLRSISPLDKHWLRHISDLTTNREFDIIQVEMPWMVSQILTLPLNSKRVFIHHEIGVTRRSLEICGKDQSEYMIACRAFADYNEIALLNKYDMVVTLSSVDARKLKEYGVSAPISVSMAVVSTSHQTDYVPSNGKRLVFIGPEEHAPNLIGVVWFLENCWARLKEEYNDYSLDIIGIWSEQKRSEISKKYQDVSFCGYVEDLAETLKNAIMIGPITIGSGVRMKILEASSRGIPFVSTSVGAEGLPVEDAKHCFIADDPDTFIRSIIKLQNKDIQRKFVANTRNMIKDYYTLSSLRRNRIDIYSQLLNLNQL